MAEQFKLIHPVKCYRDFIDRGIRPDGREFTAFRPMILNMDIIGTADGSAIVKMGQTNVVCGIRAELAKPKNKTPEEGFFVPSVSLTVISTRKHRDNGLKLSTKVVDQSDILTSIIYDILTNADCIDLNELCIHKGKLVWALYCDVIVINHDGCLIDASLLSICAALRNLKLPKVVFDPEINKIDVDITIKKKINIKTTPIAISLMIFEDEILLIEPTAEEETLSSALMTISVCNSQMCFILKSGGTPLNEEQMKLCTEIALARESCILEFIKNNEIK